VKKLSAISFQLSEKPHVPMAITLVCLVVISVFMGEGEWEG